MLICFRSTGLKGAISGPRKRKVVYLCTKCNSKLPSLAMFNLHRQTNCNNSPANNLRKVTFVKVLRLASPLKILTRRVPVPAASSNLKIGKIESLSKNSTSKTSQASAMPRAKSKTGPVNVDMSSTADEVI